MLPSKGRKGAEGMARFIFQGISQALLRTAVLAHSCYVEQLRTLGGDIALSAAHREAKLDAAIKAHFKDRERAHKGRTDRLATGRYSLRHTVSRIAPLHTYDHGADLAFSQQMLPTDTEDEYMPLYSPYAVRPFS